MDLFDSLIDPSANLLPADGTVNYYGSVIAGPQADAYLADLLDDIAWQHDQSKLYGKRIVTKRKIAWYGDHPFEYTYSNITRKALLWHPTLLTLKQFVEKETAESFNSCLMNLYHSGKEGMAWHSDGERDLKKHGAIASLSFGAERKFSFKHKRSGQTVSLVLQHGSLLVMKGLTQSHWLHRLPPTTTIDTPRVNLTFRTIEGY